MHSEKCVTPKVITHRASLFALLAILLSAVTGGAALSVCEYEPPESRISDLGLQGTFNWYDGPFADDRSRAVSASLVADYNGLFSSPSFGQGVDVRAEIRGAESGWTADLAGSASLRAFLSPLEGQPADLFAVGAAGLDATTRDGLELDLTGGIGAGRFRDVTPLAQAIRIQDELLDLGELLAPIGGEALLELARTLGEIGPSTDEKAIDAAYQLTETGLISGDEIGVRGLLTIEDILTSSIETRLCGHDVQARVGLSALLLPETRLSTTGILLARFAAVPDPVSQFDSSAEGKIRLANPNEMRIDSSLSYVRRLPNGWTARGNYRMSIDRNWAHEGETVVSHLLTGSLTTQVLGSVALSLVGDLQYRTGDEEVSLSVAVHLEADLF